LGIVVGEGVEAIKVVPMGEETGISLTNQLTAPFCKEPLGLWLNLHTIRAFIF
jgi:hypothetical protein